MRDGNDRAASGSQRETDHGQRHFLDSEAQAAELAEDSPLREVVGKQHPMGTETWHELNLDRLFESPEFLNGAAQ